MAHPENNSLSTTILNLEQPPLLESTTIEQPQFSQLQDQIHVDAEKESEYVRDLASFVDSDIPIKARIYNFPTKTKIKQLKSQMYNNYVSISGTVVRVGTMQPYSVRMAFKCPKCGKHFVRIYFFLMIF
jgi:DNA replicative helicase MCM subunit Mcm2 (Cdc46/Mcm family)